MRLTWFATLALVRSPLASDEAPAVVGWGATLTFYAFLTVMLVVPWIMTGGPRNRDVAGTAAVSSGRDSAFSSDRERRFWWWALAVLVAIYSTLGPVGGAAAFLRERNLLGATGAAVLLVVFGCLAVPWLRRRPGRREVGAALGVLAVYLVTLIRIPVPEARSHLFEYGLVALLIHEALTERKRNGRRVWWPPAIAVFVTAILGWVDEGIQAFLPNRVYDLVDVGFNALAALMAITASLLIAGARRLDLRSRVKRLMR